MNQFTSKSLMTRLCLMSFILLCSVFTSENVFSMSYDKAYMKVYCSDDNILTCRFQVYGDDPNYKDVFQFMKRLDIEYSENNKKFNPLISFGITPTREIPQGIDPKVTGKILDSKSGAIFEYRNATSSLRNSKTWLTMKVLKYSDNEYDYKYKTPNGRVAIIEIKWHVTISPKSLNYVRAFVHWDTHSKGNVTEEECEYSFKLKNVKTKSKALKESNSNVKVIGKADMVRVTGVNSGETIKVYNAFTNVEVKSVIAHDNVVNIRLPKGKVYLIQVGSKSTKVAL